MTFKSGGGNMDAGGIRCSQETWLSAGVGKRGGSSTLSRAAWRFIVKKREDLDNHPSW